MARQVAVTIGIPQPVAPPEFTARFPGDPGDGNLYIGASPASDSIATFTAKGVPLSMIRVFSGTDTPPWAAVDDTIDGGRIPWMSWKNGSRSIADIAAGVHDSWIDGIAANITARAPWPVWWTWYHEPENDSVTGGSPFNPSLLANYRAAQRRIKLRFRAAGVTNETFIAVLYQTPFTFNETASGRDWRTFYPDWKATTGVGTSQNPDPNDFYLDGDPNSVVDVFGLDFYHAWFLNAGITHWGDNTAQITYGRYGSRTAFLGKPYAVGEWATMAAQDGITFGAGTTLTQASYNAQVAATTVNFYPLLTQQWMEDYYEFQRVRGLVAMCYWDSDPDSDLVAQNGLSLVDPNQTRWVKLADIATRSTSVLYTP